MKHLKSSQVDKFPYGYGANLSPSQASKNIKDMILMIGLLLGSINPLPLDIRMKPIEPIEIKSVKEFKIRG